MLAGRSWLPLGEGEGELPEPVRAPQHPALCLCGECYREASSQ
jgi:hypothetical protein